MPITPGVLEASNLFRAQLLAQERRAASAMVRYYGHIWTQLQPQIATLQAEVTALQAAGVEFSKTKLWRLERLRAIETQVTRELAGFSQYAGEAITAQQRVSITLAEQHAQALLEAALPTDAAALATFGRMPRGAVEALVGSLAEGSPLTALIQKAVGAAAGDFMETLVEGLALGWGPRKTAAALRQRFGMGLTDALRIARTGQLHAYRTATLRAYRESGIVVEWERMSAQDDRVCLACLLLDGKIYTLEEEMEDHPNGRCSLLPRTKTWRELGLDVDEPDFSRELGRDWFLRQSAATQSDMMGPGAWQAWQDGKFVLDDIPKLVKSDIWGNGWVPKSLEELLQ